MNIMTSLPLLSLFLGLILLLVIILLAQGQRTGKTISLWLGSALVGILLGATLSYAAVKWYGYELMTPNQMLMNVSSAGSQLGESDININDDGMSDVPGGPPGGAMAMMAGMGGPGGGRSIPPKRQLAILVQKLELLTGDIQLELTPEQSESLAEILNELSGAATLSDEQAEQYRERLLAVLNEEQKAKEEKISLPRRRGGGGSGGGDRGEAAEDQNPFAEEEGEPAEALQQLRQRVASAPQS